MEHFYFSLELKLVCFFHTKQKNTLKMKTEKCVKNHRDYRTNKSNWANKGDVNIFLTSKASCLIFTNANILFNHWDRKETWDLKKVLMRAPLRDIWHLLALLLLCLHSLKILLLHEWFHFQFHMRICKIHQQHFVHVLAFN